MSNTPSDEDIAACITSANVRCVHPDAETTIDIARAVLAKWGTSPQPVVREPLTAYEIHESIKAFKESENLMGVNHMHVARAIERAHGITHKGGA